MDLPVSTTRLTPAQAVLLLPAALLLLAAVFVPVPSVVRGPAVFALLDFGHFSLAAAACWFLWARMGWPGWAAFAAVVVAAALCEVLQSFTGRCPNSIDFLRGLSGALAVLICLTAFRPSVPTARWIGASLIVIAVSAWPISEFLLAAARLCIRFSSGVG
jgi:VanZ family protein